MLAAFPWAAKLRCCSVSTKIFRLANSTICARLFFPYFYRYSIMQGNTHSNSGRQEKQAGRSRHMRHIWIYAFIGMIVIAVISIFYYLRTSAPVTDPLQREGMAYTTHEGSTGQR